MSEDRHRFREGRDAWNRRQVLQGLGLAALAMTPLVGRIAFSGTAGAEEAALDSAAKRLRSLFDDPGDLGGLGREYLATSAPRPDRAALVRHLLPPGTSPQRIAEMQTEQLRSTMASMIQADLRDGRLMVIEGWLLSETELRLAALVVLTPA